MTSPITHRGGSSAGGELDQVGAQGASPEPGDITGWSVVLPAGWWHILLNDQRLRVAQRLLDHLLRAYPRDQVFQLRAELASQLTRLLDDAVDAGSSDVYLLADLRYGLPLAASCVATPTEQTVPADLPGEALALILADEGDWVGTVTVEGQECAAIVRRTSTIEASTDDGESDAEPVGVGSDAPALEVTRLDVFVPFPQQPRVLLLSFSTPIAVLAQEMIQLFAAIAGSLRWRRE